MDLREKKKAALAALPAEWSSAKKLSALGRPGYSDVFAEKVLARWLSQPQESLAWSITKVHREGSN